MKEGGDGFVEEERRIRQTGTNFNREKRRGRLMGLKRGELVVGQVGWGDERGKVVEVRGGGRM